MSSSQVPPGSTGLPSHFEPVSPHISRHTLSLSPLPIPIPPSPLSLRPPASGAADKDRPDGAGKAPLDNGRINTILWLTDWRVALLLIGSTYILGLGLTFLTLIDEVLPPDMMDIKTVLAIVFLFSGMTGMVAIGSFVDATREYISTLRGVLVILTVSYVAMSVAWQFSIEALLYASTSLVAAATFAVMPVALEVAVELTYGHGLELEGAINSWIAVIGSSIWNSITIYVADPSLLNIPLIYTGWLWLAYALLGVAMLIPVDGRLHRMEDEQRKRALHEMAANGSGGEGGSESGSGWGGSEAAPLVQKGGSGAGRPASSQSYSASVGSDGGGGGGQSPAHAGQHTGYGAA